MMSCWVNAGCLRLFVLALVVVGNGCATPTVRGPIVKERLIRAMQPIQTAEFVEITGTFVSETQPTARSFILLMGPYPKFMYQGGDDIVFNDGRVQGRIDVGEFPVKELLREVHTDEQNMAMSVAMVGGPAILALVREGRMDDRWLSMFHPPGPATTTYEEADLGHRKREIVITVASVCYRFVFDGPEMTPVSLEVVPSGEVAHSRRRIDIARIEYPLTVADIAFQPYCKKNVVPKTK